VTQIAKLIVINDARSKRRAQVFTYSKINEVLNLE